MSESTSSADLPESLRYTAEHEWAVVTEGNIVRVGITDFAQAALGDIVFVSVHEVGADIVQGDVFGEVESTKSVSDLYSPVSGKVVARNEALDDHPEKVNDEPYGDGWIADIEVEDIAVLGDLLDADQYRALTESDS
jgi:glycine cleavage system H protein